MNIDGVVVVIVLFDDHLFVAIDLIQWRVLFARPFPALVKTLLSIKAEYFIR